MIYSLLRFVTYRRIAEGDYVFSANPIQELWRISRALTVALIITGFTSYALPLLFALALARVIGEGSELILEAADVITLGLIAGATFVLTLIRLGIDNLLSVRLCQKLDRLLCRPSIDTGAIEQIERLALRDFSALLDNISSALGLVVLPIFLLAVAVVALLSLGDAGLAAIGVLLITLPMSHWIGRRSSTNFELIMLQAADRIERCSRWIANGPVTRQFGRSPQLDLIEMGLGAELTLRDTDSRLRGIDSYLIGFGRLLPGAVLGVVGGAADLQLWSGSVVWLAIPILVAVLHLPRAYVSFRLASVSLQALVKISQTDCVANGPDDPVSPTSDGESFVFDERWPIWPSRLHGLLPARSTIDRTSLQSLFVAFRLIPELGLDLDSVLDKEIAANGLNISRGQRCRVQILRGLFVAKASMRRMIVPANLPSLDASVEASVLSELAKYVEVIVHGDATQRFAGGELSVINDHRIDELPRRYERSACPNPAIDATYAGKTPVNTGYRCAKTFRLLSLLRLVYPGIALFLLPAAMLAMSSDFVQKTITLNPMFLLIYVAMGIALGTLIGLFVERRIRSRFATRLLSGLEDIVEDTSSFSLHVASRDLTTIFERIAWYAHDIAWVSALIFLSIGSLWLAFGGLGLVVAAITVFALVVLYLLAIGPLQRTRLECVEGVDALIKSVRATHLIRAAYSTALNSLKIWLDRTRCDALYEGIALFYETRTNSIFARTTAVAAASLILSSTLVGLVAISLVSGAAAGQVIAPITILLLIQSDFHSAFLAITGLKSQAISVDRLERFAQAKNKVLLERRGCAIKIAPVSIGRIYQSHALKTGHCYSLCAPSGQGKTRYLKALAGIVSVTPLGSPMPRAQPLTCTSQPHSDAAVRCYYLDHSVLEDMFGFSASAYDSERSIDRLIEWVEAVTASNASVLLLMDEIFGSFDVERVHGIYCSLVERLSCTGSVLISVDHRVSFAKSVLLSDI